MIKVTVEGDHLTDYYLCVEYKGKYYFNDEIDKILFAYSTLNYDEIVAKFGAYLNDDHEEDNYMFENKQDAIRCRNFLDKLFN